MNRLAIVAQLKADSPDRAQELLAAGPPFRLEGSCIERHAVYLSSREVVFVFEGPEVEWKVDDLVDDFLQSALHGAFEEWRPLLEGKPRLANEAFFWSRSEPKRSS
jgi:hypothetical protein